MNNKILRELTEKGTLITVLLKNYCVIPQSCVKAEIRTEDYKMDGFNRPRVIKITTKYY